MAKALLLVNHTELHRNIYRDLLAKALVLVNPTELEIFYQDLLVKAQLLVKPDASTERLSTVSSPYMVMNNISYFVFLHSNYLKTLTEVYKVGKSMTLASHENLIESVFV